MKEIGIGIVGGGYMGKAHAVAMSAVGAVFNTNLRPRLEMVCGASHETSKKYCDSYGFRRAANNWEQLVEDEKVEAIIIASPQNTHLKIALKAFALGKPVFCEKPLGISVEDGIKMVAAAKQSGAINMMGFNYIRTPASQFVRQIVADGEIGEVTWFRGEHTEDFYADPTSPATWRATGLENGTMGDLAPHMINAALAIMGPIKRLSADVATVHASRPGGRVDNDDHAQLMCTFENGAMGHLYFSRVATGRKMGYAYEIHGTEGAIRFDQEDQNAIWLYKSQENPKKQGFKKILTGPHHPDYEPFCQGPGHGTGYQDQIIIEARDFLKAIETNTEIWPTFRDGLAVSNVVAACHKSSKSKNWVDVDAV